MGEKLGKPPIIEAWIGIQIERSSETPDWSLLAANAFLRKYLKDMPRAIAEQGRTLHVKEADGELPPQVVGEKEELYAVRLMTSNEDRCLQMLGSQLVYNVLTSGADYPGFEGMLDEAIPKFVEYLDFSRPRSLVSAALCYVDLIRIPAEPGKAINLRDYFQFAVDSPGDPYGPMASYGIQTAFQCPEDEGPLHMVLQSLPYNSDGGYAEFLMQWRKECTGIESLDFEDVVCRLHVARNYIRRCFRASVSDRAWTLFEPQNTVD